MKVKYKMKNKLFLAILLAAVVGLGACKKDAELSSEKVILSFTVDGENWCSGTCGNAITKILSAGATTLSFTPVITVSPKAQYAPHGEQDFSKPVTYTITAEDGSLAEVIVTVTVSEQLVQNFGNEASEKNIIFNILNVEEECTVTSFDQSWCKARIGKNGNFRSLVISVPRNNGSARSVEITIASDENNVQIKVNQQGISPETRPVWKIAADERIEQYRKEAIDVRVVKSGKPMSGAIVEVEMQQHEFLFGSNIFGWGNPTYNRNFAELLNFATLPFYWRDYEMTKDNPYYSSSEQIAAWCAENNIRPKGHPLNWNAADGEPSWLNGMTSQDVFLRAMGRTKACPEHFKGKIDTWDVINEVVTWHRDNLWIEAPNMTKLINIMDRLDLAKAAFAAAREGNPQATLLINDYITDDSYADLCNRLKDGTGKPLYDVIGIQSHMHGGVWSNEEVWTVCERFAKFGKPIHFTEMTILSTLEQKDWDNSPGITPTTPEGEQKQLNDVTRIYTTLFSHPAVEAITWWDFSDKNSWRNVPAGLIRTDMSPKPAYDALKMLVKKDWATNATVTTNNLGIAKLRAFRGTYRFTVTLPDGEKKVFTNIVKKESGEIILNW
jgi:GH35 family endo-1,4-beta-xylanase